MLARFRKISYLLAYIVATIPLWHYIRDGRILALMTVVIIFAYIMVVLSTVDAAQAILTSEKAKIDLPRWLPDKPKYHKWWMLVRHTLKWHLLLVPAKMGLALGFVEYFRTSRYFYTLSILHPYFYNSPPNVAYPQWETFLIGLGAIILFTILEGFLTAALPFFSFRGSLVLILRLLIALSIIGIMSQFQTYSRHRFSNAEVCFFRDCSACISNPCIDSLRIEVSRQNMRFVETTETGFLTLDGMGVLLAANIIRPPIVSEWFEWDNRPFVARQIVAGILGLLLYAGTTWVILWFVEDEPNVT